MVTEETFFAWLDGELDASEAERVAAEVAADRQLRERAEQHRAMQSRLTAAIEIGERTVSMSGRAPFYLGVLGHYHARNGAIDKAHEILEELAGLAATRYVPPHCQAYIYAGASDLDRAFEWQAKAFDDGASPFYYFSPLIENLHGDPRHRAELRRMGLRIE